ncbi:MAG: hypothetical protein JWR58_1826 [Pseudonocardia sp.]|nr:hypothetical protein [Pseudonocardia sp.]
MIVTVIAVAVAGCTAASDPAGPPNVPNETVRAALDGQWTWQRQAAPLELGVTHTQDSLDPEEPAESRRRGIDILSDSSAVWQNHHLMGFGTLNPEPSPGEYDWGSLDQRMQLTEDTGGRTVLTLCCAPDWMKGGEAGKTDWSQLEDNPTPEHFGDFAALAALAVQRYPQIERVLVWNELKGFYSQEDNRWDYESYTELYNQVYAAVKAVRPAVQVGGPYVVLTSLDPGTPDSSDVSGPWGVADRRALDVVDHWLQNNIGADFLAVDASTSTRQGTTPVRPDVGAQKYADLTTWLRHRTHLPIWWAEFYPNVPEAETGGPSSQASAAATLAAVAAYAQAGAAAALLWGPQGHSLKFSGLWTSSTRTDGGQPTPLTRAWQWLVPRLTKGDVEIGHNETQPLLAFRDTEGQALIVSLTGAELVVAEAVEPIPAWGISINSISS